MKKVRKLLAFVLALTMIMTVVPAAWMGVYADETAASNVIAEFDGTGLTVGSDNAAALANYQAIRSASFEAKNVYSSSFSAYVNKMYAVDGYNGRDGSILKVCQENYTGTADYNKNMPYIYKSVSGYKDETFTAEAYVLPDGKSEVKILIYGSTTTNPKVEIPVTINSSNVFKGTGSSNVSIGNGNWAKIAISYNVSKDGEGNTVKSCSVYLNDVLKETITLDASYVPSEARFIQIFPAGSETAPSTTEVYWDDLKIYKGTPQETYVNLDFEKMQTLRCDGMDGTPEGGTLEAGTYGNTGNQLKMQPSSKFGWNVNSPGNINGDFVFETSILMSDGASVIGTMRTAANNSSSEFKLFKFVNGMIQAPDGTTRDTYEENRWYQVTAVVDKSADTYNLYVNGKPVQEGIKITKPISADTTGLGRLGFWKSGTGSYSLRYLHIYSCADASTFVPEHRYTAEVSVAETSPAIYFEGNDLITSYTNKTDILNALTKSSDDVTVDIYHPGENGVYTSTDTVAQGDILIAKSANGKTFVYYHIGPFEKTYFDVNFDSREIPSIFTQSDKLQDGTVTQSFEKGYRSNDTYALKLAADGASWTDAYYDFTNYVKGDFVLEGTVATTGIFLVSAYDALNKAHELIMISKPYIQCNGRSVKVNNLYYSPEEWIKFTVVYKADTDMYELYINGTKALEDITAGINEKITKIRIYTAFGTGKGTTYIDNLKFMKKSYDPNSDLASVTANDTGKVYVYGDRIYTDSAETLAADATVNGVSYSLENHKIGDKIVLKNGSTIKEYIIENIPSYPIVNNFAVYKSGENIKSEADIYRFDSAGQYTMILASYDTNGTLKEVTTAQNAAGSNSITAELAKEDTKTYKAFLFNTASDMVPLCGSVTY